MVEKYKSVAGETTTEKIIEKSRFITVSRHICGEDEAKAFIEGVRKTHSDATHNCYAYVADDMGNLLRFSDDGEPQGTAGMPILEVLKSRRLYETAVVVTRYFGGIKLGAGGLLRAYSGCAAENLDRAEKVFYEPCSEKKFTVGYAYVDAALRFFALHGVNILNGEYADEVSFTAALKKSGEKEFDEKFLNALNGRVKIEKIKEYFFPFNLP